VDLRKALFVLGAAAVLSLSVAACGDDDDDDGGSNGGSSNSEELSGTIRIDGSSTVAPLTSIAAEEFSTENPDVDVSVGTSGTSGGFEKFCAGETDANDASRQIEKTEVNICGDNGVEFEEVQVANDALSVIVNPNNPLTCISIDSLNQMWDKGSEVDSWGDVDGLETEVDDEDLELFGPGSDSGTYDYWTEAVNGEEGVIRTDYNSIGENDNAAINGVAGDEWALAYVPFSFVEEAGEQVKALEIENEDGECVPPDIDTVQDGSYNPLGRPLFIYPSSEALQKPEMIAFMEYYIGNQEELTAAAVFVPMTEEQASESQDEVDALAAG
jgi:phosphate transport system substrate-binding protein